MEITKEHELILEKNHNLIFKFMNDRGLDNEWYDLILKSLIYAIKVHDEDRGALPTIFYVVARSRYNKAYRIKKEKENDNKNPVIEIVSLLDSARELSLMATQDSYFNEEYEDVYIDKRINVSVLNDRELIVCEMLEQGYTVVAIAEELGLSRRTIHRDIEKIRDKWTCKPS